MRVVPTATCSDCTEFEACPCGCGWGVCPYDRCFYDGSEAFPVADCENFYAKPTWDSEAAEYEAAESKLDMLREEGR